MTEPRVGDMLDWRMHALAAAVCAFAAVADVAVGYPWIALIPALAAAQSAYHAFVGAALFTPRPKKRPRLWGRRGQGWFVRSS